jgi:hypothetical protein
VDGESRKLGFNDYKMFEKFEVKAVGKESYKGDFLRIPQSGSNYFYILENN